MSLGTTTSRITYTGNGVTTVFAFAYKFNANADLKVVVRDESTPATPVETVKTLDTHYTVTGAGLDAGGSITFLSAPASTDKITIYRNISLLQTLETEVNQIIPPADHEANYDSLVMMIQRLEDRISRALKISDGNTDSVSVTLPAAVLDDSVVCVKADGTGFEYIAKDEVGATGPAGPAGSTGATGPAGADGADGLITALDVAIGATPNAAGMSEAAGTLTLQPAASTFPGVLSAAAQGISGLKTFLNGLTASDTFSGVIETDAATTGAAQTVGVTKFFKRLTNASLTSICGVTAPATPQLLILTNFTGGEVTVTNDATATAADRIITGTGADLAWATTSSLWLYYDTTSTRWRIVGGSGSGSGGSVVVGSDLTMTAGDTLAITLTYLTQVYRVQGNAAAISMATTAPFGSSAPADGTLIELIGNHDTNTVTLTYDDASLGLVGNFSTIELAKYQVAAFRYNTTLDRFVLAYRS